MTRTTAARAGRGALAAIVLLCGLTLLAGYANKARCTGPDFDEQGRSGPDYSIRHDRDVCYSDIQHLWLGRGIDDHVFPYLDGGITPEGTLFGGTVEYPVLTGLLIWAGAVFAHTDAGFLLGCALLMAPFGLATAWLLGRLSRWRALIWAIGPPLVLYAFHNWDLPVVACAVGAVYVLHRGWGRDPGSLSVADRGAVAAALLGLGFAFKLYPGAFLLPLALYLLTAGVRTTGRYDWLGAIRAVVVFVLTAVLVNAPFVALGREGWWASIVFQGERKVDITTNSIWYWGLRPEAGLDDEAFQSLMDVLSPALVLASFAVAAAVGWWRFRREGSYPWVAVSAAMLAGFLLLHKVHSPQYTLWLVPFFVLLRVPWHLVGLYLAADLAMGLGIFRWFYLNKAGLPAGTFESWEAQAVVFGVWGRAALLVALFVVFLRAATTFDEDVPRDDGDDSTPEGATAGGDEDRDDDRDRDAAAAGQSSSELSRTAAAAG